MYLPEREEKTPVDWSAPVDGRRSVESDDPKIPRGRGRPPLDDKRKPRGGFNDAEWAEVKAKAEAAGMTASAWLRMRAGV